MHAKAIRKRAQMLLHPIYVTAYQDKDLEMNRPDSTAGLHTNKQELPPIIQEIEETNCLRES